MSHAFGMGAMGMRIKKDIVEIGGGPRLYAANKVAICYRGDGWRWNIPGIHIF